MRLGKISIIVPIYNVQQFLNQCIESIVKQTYSNLEIILVDDGSPDGCSILCDEWEKSDQRIIVIHKKNGGLSDARNAGIKVATGDYIAFVDGDDFIELDMYKLLIMAINENNADIAVCGRYIYYNSTNKVPKYVTSNVCVMSNSDAIHEFLVGKILEEAAWDKLYRRELFDNVLFPIDEINEDLVVIPYILHNANKIVHVGVPLYNYRRNQESISKSMYNKKKNIVFDHLNTIENFIENQYPEFLSDVKLLRGRYAFSTLKGMVIDKNTMFNYKSEYQEYLKMLRFVYKDMLFKGTYNTKQKVFIILLIIQMYGFIYRIKKIIESWDY